MRDSTPMTWFSYISGFCFNWIAVCVSFSIFSLVPGVGGWFVRLPDDLPRVRPSVRRVLPRGHPQPGVPASPEDQERGGVPVL